MRNRTRIVLMMALGVCAWPGVTSAAEDSINPPPTPRDWQAIAKLPDWSGVWTPVISDQVAQEKTNPPPWSPQVAKQMQHMYAEEKAGRPFPIIDHCFPTGMPSWMLITHNALEILFTPGRVTILGEGDGNRLRRIYTDGRPHPADPDPSFHGHSIGHWEGDTLVVDTVGLLPQVYLAVNEAVGVPNNGDMHIVERLHLQGLDTLLDDLQIFSPCVVGKTQQGALRAAHQGQDPHPGLQPHAERQKCFHQISRQHAVGATYQHRFSCEPLPRKICC